MTRELPETPLTNRKGSLLGNATFQGLAVLVVAIVFVGVFLMRNRQPSAGIALPAPDASTPSAIPDWRVALENQVDNPITAIPTLTQYPTLPPTFTPAATATSQIVSVDEVEGTPLPTRTPPPTGEAVATIEFRGATPVPSPTGVVADGEGVASNVDQFQPPAEQIPLSLQPNDHFYMRRPVDASANGASVYYYPYGSSGGGEYRIHHGIDIPNRVGEHVVAAADGTVVFSGRNRREAVQMVGTLEVYGAYGEMIVIEHDFSFEGQRIWTLYAHMSSRTVEVGQRVKMGDIIGFVGETGTVTGPHVHFEVRVGTNNYWNTRNPLLWIAPYLNHGVVAGRVIDNKGNYVQDALVQVNRAGRRVDSSTTYLRPPQPDNSIALPHVIPDENWQENFVMSDVPVGDYQLVVIVNNNRYTRNISVRAGMVNFFEFQVEAPQATPVPRDIDEDPQGGGD